MDKRLVMSLTLAFLLGWLAFYGVFSIPEEPMATIDKVTYSFITTAILLAFNLLIARVK